METIINDFSQEYPYTPADLAKASGVSVRTIQKWTKLGKLPVQKDKRGWRQYSLEALAQAIKLGKEK